MLGCFLKHRSVVFFLIFSFAFSNLASHAAEQGYWKRIRVEKRPEETEFQHWWEIVQGNIGPGGISSTYFSRDGKKRDGGQYSGSFLWTSTTLNDHLIPGRDLTIDCRVYIHGREKVTAGVVFSGRVYFAKQSGGGKAIGQIETKWVDGRKNISQSFTSEIPGREGYGDVMDVLFRSHQGSVAYMYKWQAGPAPGPSGKSLSGENARKGIQKDTLGIGDVPVPTGHWSCDTGDLENADVSMSFKAEGSGITSIEGTNVQDRAVAIPAGSNYIMTTPAKPNKGNKYVNTYTLLWDVRIPQSSLGKWICLLQTSEKNENDGDLFINKEGKIGCSEGLGGYSGKSLASDKWYRIVLRVDCGNSHRVYVNGKRWLDGGAGTIDGRYALAKTLRIAADESGEDAQVHLSNISFWDILLSEEEIAALASTDMRTPKPTPKPDPTPTPSPMPTPIGKRPAGKRTGILSEGGGGMPMETEGKIINEVMRTCIKGDDTPYTGEAAVYWSPTQIRSLCTYEEGVMTGPYTRFYESGKTEMQGQRIEGVKRGWFKFWDESGSGVCSKFFADDNSVEVFPFDHDPKKAIASKGKKKGIESIGHLGSHIVDKEDRTPWESFRHYHIASYDEDNTCWVFAGMTVQDLCSAIVPEPDKFINKRESWGTAWTLTVVGEDRSRLQCVINEVNYKGRRLGYITQFRVFKNGKSLFSIADDTVAVIRANYYR